MEFYNLGEINWFDSQVIYHALAHLGREALVICSPGTPYICAGYHQDLMSEIDLEACRQKNLPFFRREVGGGLVYLDNRQVFFQIILNNKNPAVPLNHDRFYRQFLEPVLNTLRTYGLKARLQSPCDLVIHGKKISGNGAGQIGDCYVLVGNVLLDFDYSLMASVIRAPSERFRRTYFQQMQSHITTLRAETGRSIPAAEIRELLGLKFAGIFPLIPALPNLELRDKVRELSHMYNSLQWLQEPGYRIPYRNLKVSERCYIRELRLNDEYMDLNCLLVIVNSRIRKIECSPNNQALSPSLLRQLEKSLLGVENNLSVISSILNTLPLPDTSNIDYLARAICGSR